MVPQKIGRAARVLLRSEQIVRVERDGFCDDGSRSLPIPHLRSARIETCVSTPCARPAGDTCTCTYVFGQFHCFGLVVQLDAQVRIGFRNAEQVSSESRAKIDDEAVPERFEDCRG